MSNFNKWQSYTSGLPAPQNFVDWAFYYLIAACLQRRVWCFSDEDKCYANMFVIEVGPPGTGKGLVTKRLTEMLKYHKLQDLKTMKQSTGETEQKLVRALQEEDLKEAQAANSINGESSKITPPALLFPVAADAVTYESLVQSMAKSYRRVTYPVFSKELGKEVMKVQGHSSLAFVLDELSSLMRKRTEDTVNFLLTAYNCSEEYLKKTKTQGDDRILRVCLNLFAGTTPDFMESVFDDKIIGNGFSSRTFFICATKARFPAAFMPRLTEEQLQHKQDILDHIRKLYFCFGECILDKETLDWFQQWKKEDFENPSGRTNKSAKLIPYYERKNIHIAKLAMAIHFSDSTDMHIPLSCFKRAKDVLDKEEANMHLALSLDSGNPLAAPSRKILEHLEKQGRDTFKSLLITFWGKVNKQQLEETLSTLEGMGKVRTSTELVEGSDSDRVMYYHSI